MTLRQTIFTGLAMLLLYLPLKSEITTTVFDQSIAVHTDKEAVEGYKGCDASNLKKMPAYVFDLQIIKPGKQSTCGARSPGSWTSFSKKNSTDGTALFEHLPEGKYRIICYSGTAIGCEINGYTKGFPNKSIVYEKEVSPVIHLNESPIIPVENKRDFLLQTGLLKVFPNPASDEINIHFKNEEMRGEVTIALVNLLGQTVASNPYLLDKNISSYRWTINVQNQPPGAYFISLTGSNGKSHQQKILIQRNY